MIRPAGGGKIAHIKVLREARRRSLERSDSALMKVRFRADADLNPTIVAASLGRAASRRLRALVAGDRAAGDVGLRGQVAVGRDLDVH